MIDLMYFSSVKNNIDLLKKELDDCKSVIDLGCGRQSNIKYLKKSVFRYGVDLYKKDLLIAKKNKTHNFYILDNIFNIKKHFKNKSVDACVMLDVIEHLPKIKAKSLLKELEQIACKKILVMTPNGFLPQASLENKDLQEHISGWTVAEMKKLGFRVYGINGPKILRGEFHKIKYKPMFFWVIVSYFFQKIWCYHHPQSAAAIFCVKELG